MRLKASLIIVLIVLAFLCPVALADEASKTSPDADSDSSIAKNWEFSLSPMYLWAASIDGHMTVNGIRVDVDQSFSDTLDNLDGALMFHFEGVHRQRWGFFADLMYIRLDPDDVSTPLGLTSILTMNKPWRNWADFTVGPLETMPSMGWAACATRP